MNCRRVSNVLSAYLDAELTGSEMLEIRAHLDTCSACREEYESLQDTKHLLAALALQAPRAEFEALMRAEAVQAASPWGRWVPFVLAGRPVGDLVRPKPLFAAAALSVVALFFATGKVDTPADGMQLTAGLLTFETYPRLDEPRIERSPFLPASYPTPLTWNSGNGGPYSLVSCGPRETPLLSDH